MGESNDKQPQNIPDESLDEATGGTSFAVLLSPTTDDDGEPTSGDKHPTRLRGKS